MTQAAMASDRLAEAFPQVDPGAEPFGSRVLVQFRTPKKKTAGGIILTDETIETEPEGRGIRNVTLSYTFYPTQGFDPEASASSGAAPAPL